MTVAFFSITDSEQDKSGLILCECAKPLFLPQDLASQTSLFVYLIND